MIPDASNLWIARDAQARATAPPPATQPTSFLDADYARFEKALLFGERYSVSPDLRNSLVSLSGRRRNASVLPFYMPRRDGSWQRLILHTNERG